VFWVVAKVFWVVARVFGWLLWYCYDVLRYFGWLLGCSSVRLLGYSKVFWVFDMYLFDNTTLHFLYYFR